MDRIRLLNGKILLRKVDVGEMFVGSIFIPEKYRANHFEGGEVIDLAERDEPYEVRKGDIAIVSDFAGVEIEDGYLIVGEEDIIGYERSV